MEHLQTDQAAVFLHVPALPNTIRVALKQQSLQADIRLDDHHDMASTGAPRDRRQLCDPHQAWKAPSFAVCFRSRAATVWSSRATRYLRTTALPALRLGPDASSREIGDCQMMRRSCA